MVLPKKENTPEFKFYKYPKVDSFDLYRNYVGEVILKSILPKEKRIHPNRGHFAQKGVMAIRNAQNREYEKRMEEFQKDKTVGQRLINMSETPGTVGFMQMIYRMFGSDQ